MRVQTKVLFALLLILSAAASVRAALLFSDNFNYPNGLVETDGLWYAYSPAVPHQDALVFSNRLILNQANYDGVAAPSNNFTLGGSGVYASFTLNVSSLPTRAGGYFAEFKDYTNDYVCRIFLATSNTVVPGTYQLAIANADTAVGQAGLVFYPLDLATNTTYQVVVNYDPSQGATLWINPASQGDFNVYPTDLITNAAQLNMTISQIAFNQYSDQGIAAIGNVMVGDNYSDVVTNAPQAPVLGIQPLSATNYAYDSVTLYAAASGTGQLSYQWLSNSVPLTDDGVTVIGSQSNVLELNSLQNTATYTLEVINGVATTLSSNAVITVITTPTPPFFTSEPYGATNTLFSYIYLSAQASGTGPLTYQWYYEPTNLPLAGFTALSGQTSASLYLGNLAFANTGYYYVTATGGDGSANSVTCNVVVTPPLTVTISQLHGLMQTNNSGTYTIGLGNYVTVQGIVSSFAPFSTSAKTYGEFYMEDTNQSGIYVYIGGQGNNSVPPAGSLVTVTGPCQVYSGQLEIDPTVGTVINGVTNGFAVLNANSTVPPSLPLNFGLMATNSLGAYGLQVQCALVTVTNVYIYATSTGGAVSGTFASNTAATYYLTAQPYAAGVSNLVMYVYASNGEATNFWFQPIPSHAYEITGIMGQYKSTPELYPTRFVDLVTAQPAPFAASLVKTNGALTLTWPAATGSTYSIYSATNLTGPWTKTFGVGYYPSLGVYAPATTAKNQFFKISTP